MPQPKGKGTDFHWVFHWVYQILYTSKPRVSQPQQYWQFGPDTSLLWRGCPVHCNMLSSNPGFYLLDANSIPAPLTPSYSWDIVKCPGKAGGGHLQLAIWKHLNYTSNKPKKISNTLRIFYHVWDVETGVQKG